MAVRYGSPLKRALTFHIPLALLVGATLFPFYWMVITSIRPDVELYSVKMNPFFTLHPTLKHFEDLFELTYFLRWAWNTLFIAIVSTAISLFCGLLAGYALARLQFRWAPPLGTMIFITYLVPPTLLFIPLGDVVKTFGIGDTPWAVILTYPTFLIPFCTWLLMDTSRPFRGRSRSAPGSTGRVGSRPWSASASRSPSPESSPPGSSPSPCPGTSFSTPSSSSRRPSRRRSRSGSSPSSCAATSSTGVRSWPAPSWARSRSLWSTPSSSSITSPPSPAP